MKTICPVCKGAAMIEPKQENTIYCNDPDCSFMGIIKEVENEGIALSFS